jgi:hypothetical protein
MPGLTKEHVRVIKYLEPQGVTTTRTKDGLLFRMPDGGTEMLHYTQSDWRGTRNFRANLRRHGVEYPGDYQDRGKRRKPPYADSIAKVEAALADLNPDQVTTVEICKATGQISSTVTHVMIHLGWWHDYKTPKSKQTFVWHPPFDPTEIVELVEDAEPEPEPETRPVPGKPGVREFLDSVESWTVDLATLDPTTTLGQLVKLYAASALHVEVRIWREVDPAV